MSRKTRKTPRRLPPLKRPLSFEERRLIDQFEARSEALTARLKVVVDAQTEPEDQINASLRAMEIIGSFLETVKTAKALKTPAEAQPIFEEAFSTAEAAIEMLS